jgi:hypothetical protein
VRTQARFPEVPAKAGHYESFYLKLTQPGGGRGAWIRHTVHKRPGEQPTCALWFVLFDAEAAGPRATKRQFGAGELGAPADSYIRVADAILTDGGATGRVESPVLEAGWDLSFSDSHEPFHHLPRELLYRAPLPKTKFLSPYPDAIFNGHLELDGERIDVEGWRGMIGHNWGSEHAERWVWVQGSGFQGRSPEDYFDMAVGRIKVGGATTPWVGNAMLMMDGQAHRLGGFGHIPSTHVSELPTAASFMLKGKGVALSGSVSAPAKDFVAWIYADPVGPEHNTLNCSISDLELRVEVDGRPPETLKVSRSAAYEFGTRDRDHGIPVQPYPDG